MQLIAFPEFMARKTGGLLGTLGRVQRKPNNM
jgi:hypothetical protein